jgi:alkylhydroperoxidase family enzyme
MTSEQYTELQAVIALASTTNALATSMQVPVDQSFNVIS